MSGNHSPLATAEVPISRGNAFGVTLRVAAIFISLQLFAILIASYSAAESWHAFLAEDVLDSVAISTCFALLAGLFVFTAGRKSELVLDAHHLQMRSLENSDHVAIRRDLIARASYAILSSNLSIPRIYCCVFGADGDLLAIIPSYFTNFSEVANILTGTLPNRNNVPMIHISVLDTLSRKRLAQALRERC